MVDRPTPEQPWRHVESGADARAALAEAAAAPMPSLLLGPGTPLSPHAAAFMTAVLARPSDPHVAGVALALPRLHPGTTAPFVPVEDGSDIVYLRRVNAPALLLTPAQAAALLVDGDERRAGWVTAPLDSWFLCPRSALADGGVGSRRLLLAGARDWRFVALNDSLARYDDRFEMEPAAIALLAPALAATLGKERPTVDLWGDAPAQPGDALLLSARPCAAPLRSFPLEAIPLEANLLAPDEHGFFSLGRARDFAPMTAVRRAALVHHLTRYNDLGDYAGQFLAPLHRLVARHR